MSYSRTEKHLSYPNFKIQSSHKDLLINTSSNFIPCTPNKPFRRVPTVIPYNKQLKRENKSFNEIPDTSYQNDSEILRKKVRTVDMNKNLPRKKFLFEPPEFSLSYEPNKDVVMKNPGKVISFNNVSSRKDLFIINQTPDPYDVNLNATHPKEKSFCMSKATKKIIDDHCPLPSFMQSIHNRLSLSHSSMKSILLDSGLKSIEKF